MIASNPGVYRSENKTKFCETGAGCISGTFSEEANDGEDHGALVADGGVAGDAGALPHPPHHLLPPALHVHPLRRAPRPEPARQVHRRRLQVRLNKISHRLRELGGQNRTFYHVYMTIPCTTQSVHGRRTALERGRQPLREEHLQIHADPGLPPHPQRHADAPLRQVPLLRLRRRRRTADLRLRQGGQSKGAS